MKINFLKKSTLLLPLFLIILLSSCEKDDAVIDNDSANFDATITDIELTKEELSALEHNGIILDRPTVQKYNGIAGGAEANGLLIDDNFVSHEQLEEWIAKSNSRLSIMRNNNRVSIPNSGKRTIRIGLVNRTFERLNNRQRNAAITAIQRYQALNIKRLRFVIQMGDQNNPDMVIFNNSAFAGPFDGRADFPSNGNPGFRIGLHSRTRNFNQNNITVLIQHEMGHTLGLVHADFRTRRSCGGNGTDVNPNQTEVIPGTNGSGNFTNSIMRACGFFQFGNFRADDRRSLRRAYNGNNF